MKRKSEDSSLAGARDPARQDAELNEALNDLERILGKRAGRNGAVEREDAASSVQDADLFDTTGPASDLPADLDRLRSDHSSDDWALPLDAGLPASGAPDERPSISGSRHAGDRVDDEQFWSEALTHKVAERLASELEVITQACLEESLEHVAAEVRRRIRAHIAIVLPEILEEMAREEFGPRDE